MLINPQKGDPVKVIRGPFAGETGIVEEPKAGDTRYHRIIIAGGKRLILHMGDMEAEEE